MLGVGMAALVGGFLAGTAGPATAAERLVIESWRSDDLAAWQDTIIPAFTKDHPDIDLVFAPSPPTEYNAALNAKLDGGTAGDIIACRPFDASLALFKKGQLADLSDLKGMDRYPAVAKGAWSTDDGKQAFCVPLASVIHGFIYNKQIFDELGLRPPGTVSEFFALLDKVKENGSYAPLDMGTAEQWEAATMGFQNIGPNYWHGETGREALIAGTARFTDQPYVETFAQIARWKGYLPDGFEAQKYADSQNLFSLGRAAIYPAGSWDISVFEKDAQFPIAAFKPPVPDGQSDCYISDHTDIALGLNPKSPHAAAARAFLEWTTTPEFAALYANALPGFYSLQTDPVTVKDPVAQQFLGWRQECRSTIRNSYQILSRGEPNLENQLWNVSAQVVNGTMTPQAATAELQKGLDSWYKPQR